MRRNECGFDFQRPLQWQGATTGEVVESGIGWTHLNIAFSSVDPNVYYIAAMQAVVDAGGLAKFAKSSADILFLQRSNVSTLFVPEYHPESDGHNSGNRLTCLWTRENYSLLLLVSFASISISISISCLVERDFDLFMSLMMVDILQLLWSVLMVCYCAGCGCSLHTARTLYSSVLLSTAHNH
jgi:hypothetical protein